MLNSSKYIIISLISDVCFTQSDSWTAVPVLCTNTGLQSGVLRSPNGKLPVVPFADTGTIPYSTRQQAEDFQVVGAALDTREGPGDDSRW
jgi:hypothetical protein